jgi:hypothetical protein
MGDSLELIREKQKLGRYKNFGKCNETKWPLNLQAFQSRNT